MRNIQIAIDRPFVPAKCEKCNREPGSPCCDGRGWVIVQWDNQDRISLVVPEGRQHAYKIPLDLEWYRGLPRYTQHVWGTMLGVAASVPGAAFVALKYGGLSPDEMEAVRMALDDRDGGEWVERRMRNQPSEAKLRRGLDAIARKAESDRTVSIWVPESY